MQECGSCGTQYRLTVDRDRIFHFRLMPEMACVYTVCPNCDYPYIGFYGENQELLMKHVEILKVHVYSVPTEDMIQGFRGIYNKPWCEPKELTLDDLKEVRKFRAQMDNEADLDEMWTAWNKEER